MSNDQVKSNLTRQIEANGMLFMDGTRLKTSMHSHDRVNSNQTLQIEANAFLFTT